MAMTTTRTDIRRLLVANRGEIACRVMRTARLLGISTVAVHSDVDADARHVREADRAVRLPGVTSAETYLDGAAVIAAAQAAGADAIHPGYGFLSENPGFARAVRDAGLTWIGPTPESIEAMALKVEAKRIAAAAGVPLVPGAELADEMSDDELVRVGDGVGYPLLIKASAGGGGRGMRVVADPADLIEAIASARREARSAFGDGTVFVERYLAGARHVEVQVFGDTHGNVVHLFERECSIQRRHQKIIEEAPSPGVTPAIRQRLHESAVSLARAIGYVGAGTVEFMVFGDGDSQEYSFLEMNTRLQVEHPVTEAITGTDLVAWQLAVAQGEPLPLTQVELRVHGHAIEARLYAEDPSRDHAPAVGPVHRFEVPIRSGLRVDAGIETGSVVTPHYDPMLAKVIGHAPTREAAAAVLADGLSRLVFHGPLCNRDSLVAILREPDFLAGLTTTAYLDEHPAVNAPELARDDVDRHAMAAAAAVLDDERPERLVPLSWRNVPGPLPMVALERAGVQHDVSVGPDVAVLACDDNGWTVRASSDGVSATCRVARYVDEVFVDDGLASSIWHLPSRFPDHSAEALGHGAVTPVPGTITAILVEAGTVVKVGQVLVVLEAMKMEHRIQAPADGVVVRVLVEAGQSVDAHALVVELEDADVEDGDAT